MKLSKKEKILICALGIGVMGYLYYDVIYLKQVAKIAEKSAQKIELENKYNYAVEAIDTIDAKISQKVILNAKVENTTNLFYPTISQEHIILELNKILSESGLTGTYSFNEIEIKEVETIEKKEISDTQSTIESLKDRYNDLQLNPESAIENVENTTTETEGNAEDSSSTPKKEQGETLEQLKCELTFQGEYSALNKFLNTIQESEKRIVVNNISITQKTLTEVSGSMSIEFYAVPKLTDEIDTYLDWTLNNVYGKEVPFSTDAASGNITSESKVTTDFIVSIKPETSVIPTVIIGKSNDIIKTSYAYANSNSEEVVEIVLSKDGNKYYYKYKTANDIYPTNYAGLGQEFIPVSDNITLDIISETRTSNDDKAALRLSIVNNTDKLVDVKISGDDSTDPRVTVEGDGSKIKVSKK